MGTLSGGMRVWGLVFLAISLGTVSAVGDNPTGLKRVIITYDRTKMQASTQSFRSAGSAEQISVVVNSVADEIAVLEGPADTILAAAARLPGVIKVEEDKVVEAHICKNGCKRTDKPVRPGSAEILPYALNMIQATVGPAAGPESVEGTKVSICVLDTGVYATHTDFVGNIISGCTSKAPYCPYPFNKPGDFHGTHITGTVAAMRNGRGVIGVIPRGADIFGVNVLPDAASGTIALVQIGLMQCEARLDALKKENSTARMVINMSFGGPDVSDSLQSMLDRLYARGDILMVASSGNDQVRTPGVLGYPASYDSVVSVGAVNCNSTIAKFSQRNSKVEIVAPGVDIMSTITPLRPDRVSVNVTTSKGSTLRVNASPVQDGGYGRVTAEVASCGLMLNTCSAGRGKICLVLRGVTQFSCKHRNALLSGCRGLLLYNNEQNPACTPLTNVGLKTGRCSTNTNAIPVAALSNADGNRILRYMRSATTSKRKVTASINVAKGVTRQQYTALDGTSMAAPQVAAAAARIWAEFPRCKNVDVRKAMTSTAKDLGAKGRDTAYGYGLLQMVAARSKLSRSICARDLSPPPPPPVSPPPPPPPSENLPPPPPPDVMPPPPPQEPELPLPEQTLSPMPPPVDTPSPENPTVPA